MSEGRLKFRIANRWEWDDIALLAVFEDYDGRITHIAEPVKIVPRPDVLTEPTMSFGWDSAQQLMNALWSVGIRPKNGEGSMGQIGATEKHLADMRKIAFANLRLRDDANGT